MNAMSDEAYLNLKFSSFEEEMRLYAKEHHVPIIQDEGLAFLELLIRLYQPKRILEIGTAIGYSAIRMQQVSNAKIVSIERNEAMYLEACKNIEKVGLEDSIQVLFKDALEAAEDLKNETFDMIFIDAAKAQYQKFFELYTPLLSNHGIVVCDNMSFHGLVPDEKGYEQQSRSVRGLIRKLKNFTNLLLENEDYATTILSIGDGIAVAVKK